MKTFKLLCLLIFSLSASLLYAQEEEEIDPMPVKLKGQVLNLDDEAPVPFAFVVNLRTNQGVSTNEQGYFTLDMLNIDSLAVSSLGFTTTVVHLPPNYNELNLFLIFAKPVRFALPEIDVQGEQQKVDLSTVPIGRKSELDPQLRGDAFDKKPSVLAAVFSPASFIQYYTSKREKEKRNTRQAIVTEKQWEYLSQYYNKELVMELTGLNEYQADSFMIYFNSKGFLTQLSSEYEVRNAIVETYKLYRQEGH